MPTPLQLSTLHDQIAPAAVASELSTGLPAELSCAQCIYESAWLSVAPGLDCFGIKSDAHGSGVRYTLTHEYLDGSWRTMSLAFETYATLADCFIDHARLITQGEPYAAAWELFLQERAAFGIEVASSKLMQRIGPIYATAPGYAAEMAAMMQEPYVISACADARKAQVIA